MNMALTITINKKVIEKHLTDPTYKSEVESKAKFRVLDDTATYEGNPLTIIDREEKTITVFKLEVIKGYAKQLQSMILKRAIELGYTEEE